MLHYLHSRKAEIIILSIWIIILNAYKIAFHVIGIDTEQALLELESNLNWTLGSGRFASAILRRILMPNGFSYDMAVLLTIIGWLMVCMAYIYCFEQLGISSRLCGFVFSMLLVACPLWAEQNYFVCSSFVNIYGMLFTIISAYVLTQQCLKKFDLGCIILPMLLAVVAIGIYQAFLYLLMANCIVFLSLGMYIRHGKVGKYIIAGIRCLSMIMAAVMIYFVCSKIAVSLFYNPFHDYAGYTNAPEYISNRMRWYNGDIAICLDEIKEYMISTYNISETYGIPFYPILFSSAQIFLIVKFVKTKHEHNIIMVIGNTLLLICVFSGCLLLGGMPSVREQFVLPLLAAFCSMFLINEIPKAIHKHDRFRKIISITLFISSFYGIMFWGSKQLQINNSDYVRFRCDMSYAEKVMGEIMSQVGNYSNQKIVFIGQNHWSLPDHYYKGNVIGYSIFSWDAAGPVGVNYRAYGFLQSCGYQYAKPSIEDVNTVQHICEAEGLFGENERVVIWNDFIAVNLNRF